MFPFVGCFDVCKQIKIVHVDDGDSMYNLNENRVYLVFLTE